MERERIDENKGRGRREEIEKMWRRKEMDTFSPHTRKSWILHCIYRDLK